MSRTPTASPPRCRDRLTGKDLTIRSKFLVGADGGNSMVAEHARAALRGQDGRRRLDEHPVRGRSLALRRAPPERPLLGHAARRRCRRHRHGPRAHGAAVERVADRLGLRHQPAAAGGRRRPSRPRWRASWSAIRHSRSTLPSRQSPGPSTTCFATHYVKGPRLLHGRRRAPPSALERAAAPTPRSRTASTSPGSSPWC